MLAHNARYGFEDSRPWFNGKIEVVEEVGFRRAAEIRPGSVIRRPVEGQAYYDYEMHSGPLRGYFWHKTPEWGKA